MSADNALVDSINFVLVTLNEKLAKLACAWRLHVKQSHFTEFANEYSVTLS